MLYSAAVPRAVATSYDCTACCDARSRSQLLATRMLQPPNDPRALQTGAAQLHTCVHGLAKRPPASGAPALLNGPRAQNTLPPRGSPRAAPPEERRRAARGQRMRRTTAWSQQPRAAHACSLARSHARTLARSHAPHTRAYAAAAVLAIRNAGGGAAGGRGGGQAWRRTRAAPALSARCRPTGRRLQSGHVQRHRGLRRHRPKHPALLSLLCPKIDRASWEEKKKTSAILTVRMGSVRMEFVHCFFSHRDVGDPLSPLCRGDAGV